MRNNEKLLPKVFGIIDDDVITLFLAYFLIDDDVIISLSFLL